MGLINMSWKSKVMWGEGLFLRPHHFQQSERYIERVIMDRTRHITPYPWGLSSFEIDHDVSGQGRFGLRRASGIMPDGLPFDCPDQMPLPQAIDVPESAANHYIWLNLPLSQPNTRDIDQKMSLSESRYIHASTTVLDTTSSIHREEEIDVAYPRFSFDIRKTPKPGYTCIPLARILQVQDKFVVLDETFVPPILTTATSTVVVGWIERIIGWIETGLDELARYADDAHASGGLRSTEVQLVQAFNRFLSVVRHQRSSRYIHPERLYEECLRALGDLTPLVGVQSGTENRRVALYPPYDHDDLTQTFLPILKDLQDLLDARPRNKLIRLELQQVKDREGHIVPNAYKSMLRDTHLLETHHFMIEVSARMPLTEIQARFPRLFIIAPTVVINDLISAALPGLPLVHTPTPYPLRPLIDHVYFKVDKNNALWNEFQRSPSIGVHFHGDWPDLGLNVWAIPERNS